MNNMKTKINYRQECLKVIPKLKSLKIFHRLTNKTFYRIILGNEKNHSTYSILFTNIEDAWKGCYDTFLAEGLLKETVTIQHAFELMLSQKEIKLSDLAKKELEESWEGSSKEKWSIVCVRAGNTIDICSDNHLVSENVGLDYIKM